MQAMKLEGMELVDSLEELADQCRSSGLEFDRLRWSEHSLETVEMLLKSMLSRFDGMSRLSSGSVCEMARESVVMAFHRVHLREVPSQERLDDLRSTLLNLERWAVDGG